MAAAGLAKVMRNARIGVGIIGASPGKGWASSTHVPAIRSLPFFDLCAVSTSRRESAEAARREFGVRLAFSDPLELIARAEVDLVVISVRVPRHYELVSAAIQAGKAVYCEWPLGNGLTEATELADLARARGVGNWVGLQSRAAPSISRIRDLVKEGYLGEVLSTTLIGSAMFWGATIDRDHAFIVDKRNGVTPLTIVCAHRLDALCYCLGEFVELSATLANRRTSATVEETGEIIAKTAEDQIAVSGVLEGGAVACVHYRGGVSRGVNLLWEINGSDGDLQLCDSSGHGQMHDVQIKGGCGTRKTLEVLRIPDPYFVASSTLAPGAAFNVAQNYVRLARDIREGTRLCATFDDALIRHRLLDAVERAAATGKSQSYARTAALL
jgi:predicted dehydrogenase